MIFLFPLSAPLPHAACCVVRNVHSITLEIETADHDNPLARYSSTFRQLIAERPADVLPLQRAFMTTFTRLLHTND
jgi:hypothetical protein